MMKHIKKNIVLFLTGGIIYIIIELLWRGYTHWSMMIAGGLCFLIIGGINEYFSWSMPLILQGIVGSIAITVIEFIFGVIFNIWLDLSVWDYSSLPLNIMGQVCIPYMLLWIPLAIIAVIVDDWLRYWWFDEQKPIYKLKTHI